LKVCIDASIMLKLLINESLSERVDLLWEKWVLEQTERIVPSFFTVEVLSALRRLGKRELILPNTEEEAVKIFLEDILPFLQVYEMNSQLLNRAWKISRELNFMHIYDAVYIALAEKMECDFWTADYKLYNILKERFHFLKCIKE